MPGADLYPLADRIVPGGLEDYLAKARDDGDSLQKIVHRLKAEHAITVSVETVRRWCSRGDDPVEVAG